MFRSLYDSDVTVWSPQGRLFQLEYAMEAVKLGTATVGIKNRDFAVLVALRRAESELSSSQRKIISIDDNLGLSFSGITTDANVISKYLRGICLSYKYETGTEYPVPRLMDVLTNKMQTSTQRYDCRPFGVGILIAGYDNMGPHIYQVDPSANSYNCKAMAIGSRSQSARTYIERNIISKGKDFNCSKDELICHGIQAVRGALPNDEDHDSPLLSISIAIVGKDQPFKILNDAESRDYLNMTKKWPAPPVQEDEPPPPPGDDDEDPQPGPGPADPEELVTTMEI